MAKVFVIGVGGTGMRCLESFVHTCAMGMYDNTEVEMLALDTDSANGNFQRLRSLIGAYNSVNGGDVKANTFFSAKINYYEFSPGYTDEDSFDRISNYPTAASNRVNSPVADFVDLFLDEDVRNMNLKHGYRAQTQMGTMLMYYAIIKGAYEAKRKLQSKARNDLAKFLHSMNTAAKMPVFIFGSVFGGTGASSIPIIPLAFREASKILDNSVDIVKDNYFGTIVLTNYFNFMVDKKNDREVVAKSENFAINSQSALMFYNDDQTVKSTYRRMYLLGRTAKEDRDVTSGEKDASTTSKGVTGGEKQENPADYIELIAAMAAYDFFKEAEKGEDAFKDDGGDKFFCIGHDYGSTKKLDFPLFAQDNSEIFKQKFGVAVAASLLDTVYDFFENVVKSFRIVNVDLDGAQFKNMRKYWGLFNLSVKDGDRLSDGWLPQMYHGKKGEGILFSEKIFECSTLKELSKIKFNKQLYAGDNPPQFNVGLLSSIFNTVKDSFGKTMDSQTSMSDLLEKTYSTLMSLYFNK